MSFPKEIKNLMAYHYGYIHTAHDLIRKADYIQKAVDRGTHWKLLDQTVKLKVGWAYVIRRVYLVDGTVVRRLEPIVSLWTQKGWQDITGTMVTENYMNGESEEISLVEVWVK
jgi:hypothetical protein